MYMCVYVVLSRRESRARYGSRTLDGAGTGSPFSSSYARHEGWWQSRSPSEDGGGCPHGLSFAKQAGEELRLHTPSTGQSAPDVHQLQDIHRTLKKSEKSNKSVKLEKKEGKNIRKRKEKAPSEESCRTSPAGPKYRWPRPKLLGFELWWRTWLKSRGGKKKRPIPTTKGFSKGFNIYYIQ